ncbi:MAG: protein kinase [Planctomycetota bacterium]
MILRQHLSAEQLRDYLQGWVDEQTCELIEQHLAECPECEETLVAMEQDPDTLVRHLRDLPERRSSIECISSLPYRIGSYELLSKVGQGGMGSVYEARHVELQKRFAVKILRSAGNLSGFEQRFQREILAAGKLDHPAIIAATDAGTADQTSFLVMEFVDGPDISRVARHVGRFELADACEIIRAVSEGIAYAHAEGVVHRDIKPSNIMLRPNGDVKILDFGLAQLSRWDESSMELTTVGQLMGTLDYMAPEQAEHPASVDYRADLYALGATLFRLLCGRPPLTVTPQMSPLAKLRMLANHSPTNASTLRPELPSEVSDLIARLLSTDPNQRPASALHVAEAISPFCEGHQLAKLAILPIPPNADSPRASQTLSFRASSKTKPAEKKSGRTKWFALAAASAFLLAAIAFSLQWGKGQLVIESEAAVTLQIRKDGEVYDRVEVRPGKTQTRLYAGQYEITIDDASDSFSLDRGTIQLERGGVAIARITEKTVPPRTELESRPMDSQAAIVTLPRSVDKIQPGERLRLKCYADSTIDQTLQVMGDYTIKVAIVGIVSAKDLTLIELEQKLNEQYREHYNNPMVEIFREIPPSNLIPAGPNNRSNLASSKAMDDKRVVLRRKLDLLRSQYSSEHPIRRRVEEELRTLDAEASRLATTPTYEGRTLDDWLALLERERSSSQVEICMEAISALAGRGDSQRVTANLLRRIEWLAVNAEETIPSVFNQLKSIHPTNEYLRLLHEVFAEGSDKVRELVLSFVLVQVEVGEIVESSMYPTWRKTLLDEVIASENPVGDPLAFAGGWIFLNWYDYLRDHPPTSTQDGPRSRRDRSRRDGLIEQDWSSTLQRQLLEPVVESKQMTLHFWDSALVQNRPRLYALVVDGVEKTLTSATSDESDIIEAFGLFAHASRFGIPSFDDREKVLAKLMERIRRRMTDTGVEYQFVDSPFGFGQYCRQPFARAQWIEVKRSNDAKHAGQMLEFVAATLDFFAFIGANAAIAPLLSDLEERTLPGAEEVSKFLSSRRGRGRPEILWPSLAIQSPILLPENWKSSYWMDAFIHERVLFMIKDTQN